MWTTEYILSQICVLIGAGFLAATFCYKEQKINTNF